HTTSRRSQPICSIVSSHASFVDINRSPMQQGRGIGAPLQGQTHLSFLSSDLVGSILVAAGPRRGARSPSIRLPRSLRSRANLRSPSRSAVGGYPVSVKAEPIEES